MKLEVVRLIVAGLADATYGINAKIAALTLDGSDTRPSNPTVYNDVDHKWVARRIIDDADSSNITFPALAVFQFAPLRAADPEVETVVRDVEIQIAFALLLNKQDSAAAIRDTLYFNRALLRWFHWFMGNDQSSSFRTKNGAIIRSVTELTQDEVEEPFGSADCVSATIATFRVRETSP